MITVLLVRSGYHWLKRNLSWDIHNESVNFFEDELEAEIREAFEKWSAVIPVDFARASSDDMVCTHIEQTNRKMHQPICKFRRFWLPSQQPDIVFEFDSELPFRVRSSTTFPIPELKVLDDQGAIITINDKTNYTNLNRRCKCGSNISKSLM